MATIDKDIFRFPKKFMPILETLSNEEFALLMKAFIYKEREKLPEKLKPYYDSFIQDVLNIEAKVEMGKRGGRPPKNGKPKVIENEDIKKPEVIKNKNLRLGNSITKEKDKEKVKEKEKIISSSNEEEASPEIVEEENLKNLKEEKNNLIEEEKNSEKNELKNSESLKKVPADSTGINEVPKYSEKPVPMSEIVKQKNKKYGDPEINKLLEIIEKYNEGIVDGTIQEQRRYGKLLLDKLKKLDKVKSGQFTREETLTALLEIISQNEYHRHKIAGPKKLFYNVAELIQVAKAEIEKQKNSEIPSF